MTIRISTTAILVQPPRSVDSSRYSITTARAVAITIEGEDIEFDLKFFYDSQSNENTIPDAFYENEGIRFTGNFAGIINNVLQINVQQAHSVGMSPTLSRHSVEINVNGRIISPPKEVTATIGSVPTLDSVEPDDDNPLSEPTLPSEVAFIMFRITATQWTSLPRNDGVAGSTGKTIPFEFTLRHEAQHRLASRTKYLTLNQNVNVLGLLEFINSKLYIQLTDIVRISTNANNHSQSSSSSETASRQSPQHDINNPPARISTSRALAAQLDSADAKTSSPNQDSPKRPRTKKTVNLPNPSLTENDSTASTNNLTTKRKQIVVEDISSSEESTKMLTPKRRNLRSSQQKNHTQDTGNVNILSVTPDIKMVGGIPQQDVTNSYLTVRVAKLRHHATAVLPVRQFSFI
jgi:hypothetical protein